MTEEKALFPISFISREIKGRQSILRLWRFICPNHKGKKLK